MIIGVCVCCVKVKLSKPSQSTVNNGTHQSCYITISAESKCNIQIYDNTSLLASVFTNWNCRKTSGRSHINSGSRIQAGGQSNLYR